MKLKKILTSGCFLPKIFIIIINQKTFFKNFSDHAIIINYNAKYPSNNEEKYISLRFVGNYYNPNEEIIAIENNNNILYKSINIGENGGNFPCINNYSYKIILRLDVGTSLFFWIIQLSLSNIFRNESIRI